LFSRGIVQERFQIRKGFFETLYDSSAADFGFIERNNVHAPPSDHRLELTLARSLKLTWAEAPSLDKGSSSGADMMHQIIVWT
jgi:hypothetical protein